MASSLNLTPAVQVFSCPNCAKTINTTVPQCPFCGTTIDRATAESEAEATSKSNAACSDASYLRALLTMAVVFFLLNFVPFLGLIGLAGTWFLRLAIPVMCVRWWIKYGALRSRDPDFARARTTAIVVTVLGVLYFFTFTLHIR